MEEDLQHSNISEEEMGQLHSLHLQENALANIRRNLKTGPSLAECEECGDDIPEARQLAVSGCTTCIHCQTKLERSK